MEEAVTLHGRTNIRATGADCRGGPAPSGNFDYSGLLTEFVLLGNLAVRLGKKIDWDGKNMQATNAPEADALIRREYRQGWDL